MEPQNTKYFSKSLIVIVAVFVAGAVIGIVADPYLPSALSNAKKGYQSGFAAARNLVEDSTLGNFFKTPEDVRSLSGKVTSVNGDRLVMHLSSVNPFDDASLSDRTVIITADTKIVTFVARDPKVYQEDLAKYRAQVSTKGAIPPQPYTQVSSDISAIKIGDSLVVTTSENVKTMGEFTAKEIQIQSAMFAK